MAYSFYGNNNYQQQPMYSGYQQQPIQPQQPYSIRANNLQYGTEEEIKAFILGANSQVMAIDPDPNKPFMYVKSTNSFGQPTFDVFKYEKYNGVTQNAVANDFSVLTSRVDKIEKALSEIMKNKTEQGAINE